jgi:hypothetical protein
VRREPRLIAAYTSSGPSSVLTDVGGNSPRMNDITHGLVRPYCAMLRRASSMSMRGERFGSSGSPVMRMTVQRFDST